MMNNYKEPQRNSSSTNELDFGIVLEKAFNNYKRIAGIAGVSILLLMILYFILALVVVGAVFGFSGFGEALTNINLMNFSGVFVVGYTLFTALVAGIVANFNAGFYKMAYAAEADKPFEVGTLFDYFKTKYFKELFLSGVLLTLIATPITLLFEYINIQFIGIIVTYAMYFFTVLTVPLIIFSNLKAVNAIGESVKIVLKYPIVILGLLVIAIIGAVLGFIGLCIGVFFTMPFLYSTIFCIYNEILPIRENNSIDEIGQMQE